MQEELIPMSQQEISRLEVMQKLANKELKQSKASRLLDLSTRQIRRLYRSYKRSGALSIVSKRRGQPSNHKLPDDLYEQVTQIIRKRYFDFGPTLACEKLKEIHQIDISKETTRQWMIRSGIWQGKKRKSAVVHQMRERRSCFGELVQIDGSPHAWFEERGDKCCLIVFIDDATGKLLSLHFEETETTFAYFKALRFHLEKHGRPAAYYSDKHSIFRVNKPESLKENQTQFERALDELGIKIICANSPQAKGRVERANSTLQDRLVKELRLRNISNIETANKFMPEFIDYYNNKFAVEPKDKTDAHRKNVSQQDVLDLILGLQTTRKLSKNLELSYKNIIYQVQINRPGYALRGAAVTICESETGEIKLLYKGKELSYKTYKKQKRTADIVSTKDVNKVINTILKSGQTKPKADHPWRSKYKPAKNNSAKPEQSNIGSDAL